MIAYLQTWTLKILILLNKLGYFLFRFFGYPRFLPNILGPLQVKLFHVSFLIFLPQRKLKELKHYMYNSFLYQIIEKPFPSIC